MDEDFEGILVPYGVFWDIMKKRKIAVTTGTRSEYGILRLVLDEIKISKKLEAKPKGFMTQVVQNIDQVQNLADNLKGYLIIPIILFPSDKNEKSAKFLNMDLTEYSKNFDEFVNKVHKITGDILLTSPSDFTGLNNFLEKPIN